MSRTKVLSIILLAIVGLTASAIWWFVIDDDIRQEAVPSVSSGSLTPSPTVSQIDVLDLVGAPAPIEVVVRASMPPDFDDGVPKRGFRGTGTLDPEDELATVRYDLSEVPNAAGYFGHVEGDATAVYVESGHLLTFPVMAKVLEGDLEWLSFGLADFLDNDVVNVGLGQLREIGLSDPRLGLSLAASASPGGGEIAVEDAAAGASPTMAPIFDQLEALQIQTVPVEVELGPNDSLKSVSYQLVYPAQPGSDRGNVKLNVSISVTGGRPTAIEVPSEGAVQAFIDYLGY